jgi:hypothetical protein
MGRAADVFRRSARSYMHMTVSERIESQSFAYDAQFPPDVAAGLPLSSACRQRPASNAPLKRALRSYRRIAARKR